MTDTWCATWSILAREPETGQLAVATASRYLAVGSVVPHVRPGVAAVCTQAWAGPHLAPRIYGALEAGADPATAIAVALVDDDHPEYRQLGIVDRHGRTATYTGEGTRVYEEAQWWGAEEREGLVVIGNTLAGPEVVAATAEAFAAADPALPLGWRLVTAMKAGEAAGGDHRGKQAAVVLVGGVGPGASEYVPATDLRVDDHPEPITELLQLYRLAAPELGPTP